MQSDSRLFNEQQRFDIARLPGSWVRATSPRRAARYEEAVARVRRYDDVA